MIATLLSACGGGVSADPRSTEEDPAATSDPDAAAPGSPDAAVTCAAAATALCNAANACGSQQAMGFASCEEGVAWASLDACITQLTAGCAPGAAIQPGVPLIVDPAACISALPRACVVPANPRLEVPASCATCTVVRVDAG